MASRGCGPCWGFALLRRGSSGLGNCLINWGQWTLFLCDNTACINSKAHLQSGKSSSHLIRVFLFHSNDVNRHICNAFGDLFIQFLLYTVCIFCLSANTSYGIKMYIKNKGIGRYLQLGLQFHRELYIPTGPRKLSSVKLLLF